MRYYRHRIARLPGSPYTIASGFAAGVAISFTPFIGFHLLLGAGLAWALRGSIMSMAIGTLFAGNPWTFPLIWVGTYKIGNFLLGEYGDTAPPQTENLTLSGIFSQPLELLFPMMAGSIPLALFFWIVSFTLVYRLIKGYKETRAARIRKH